MNAPLHIPQPERTYWHPLTVTAADMGARVVPMQHGHEVWHMGDVTMLVRIIDGVPHGLDVCGQPDGPIKVPTWIEPRDPFATSHALAAMPRRPEPTPWMRERDAIERDNERRADAREEARDHRRRTWREKSFRIE